MLNSPRSWIVLGAALAALSVVLGAFGAHGLEKPLKQLYGDETKELAGLVVPASYKYAQDWITASRYQMYHALGLILLGIVSGPAPHWLDKVAAWSFFSGTLLFSGSLYVLVLTGMRWLGAITPLGGLLMIVAWIAFAVSAAQHHGATKI